LASLLVRKQQKCGNHPTFLVSEATKVIVDIVESFGGKTFGLIF